LERAWAQAPPFCRSLFSWLELEVERQLCESALHATSSGLAWIFNESDIPNQPIASSISEVIPEVLVIRQIDLGCQMPVTWCGDEVMDVCRALTVPT
jgi:hypothetical protein